MDNGKPVTKAELDSAVGGLKSELVDAMRSQKDELVDAMRQIETNLLTEFHRYAKGPTLEDRVLALETRLPPTVF